MSFDEKERRMADEKLVELQKKESPQKKGLKLADLTRGSHWRSWGGGLPAMIAINNACLKFDFQIVKVLCSGLQCLIHRANQFPESLRTELILIRQLPTHLAHWEALIVPPFSAPQTILSGRFYTVGSVSGVRSGPAKRVSRCELH